MATDVIIDPSTGQIYWNDSAGVGTESISIKGDAVNAISFTGYSASFSPGSTPAGAQTLVTIKDSGGTDALIPGTTGYNLGSSTLRWNTFATNADLSGTLVVSSSTNSSSTTTGALKVSGGVGIVGNAFIGGTITVATPISIPNGGTNVSSFGQSAGFIYYDGANLRLLAASGATINYSNGYYQFDNRVYATSFFANNAQMPNGSGVAGRVTIWSGNNTIGSDADFTYDSTTNTLNVGLIGSGSWAASAITSHYGGTGLQSPFVVGDILYATTTTTWGRLAASSTSGQVLTSNGAASLPTWQSVPPSAASSVAVSPTTVSESHFITAVNTSSSSGLGLSTITSFVVNPNTGIVSMSGLAVTSTTGSGSTTTGALTVVGGAGIGKTLNVGGTISSIGASIFGPLYTNTIIIGQSGNNINFNDAAGNVLGNFNTSNGWFRSAQTTESNNKDSGALVSLGGLGVAKNAFIGGTASVTSTQVSISSSSGALVVTGGVGIGGTLFTSAGSTSSVSGVLLQNGNVSASTYNKLTLTAPATSATLTLANSSSLITSGANSLTLTTTAASNVTFPTAGTLTTQGNKLSVFALTSGTELAGVISDKTGTGNLVFASSPSLTTPTLGVASATSINKVTITAPTTSATLTLVDGSSLTTAGAFGLTLTTTAASNVTFPTAGTLLTSGATSPNFLTSVTTGSGTFALFNTTATTINAFGAATVMSIGAATGKATFNSTDNSTSVTTGGLVVSGGAGIAKSVSIGGRLQMFNSSLYTAFSGAQSGISTVYTLPTTSPATGSSVLQSTSTGVMSWVPMPSTAGLQQIAAGSYGYVQYAGVSNAFAAVSGFLYEDQYGQLELSNYPFITPSNGTANLKLLGFGQFWNGSDNGTFLAISAATGFSGDLIHAQVNGVSRLQLNPDGYLRLGVAGTGFTLPITNGTSGQVLTANTNGIASWTTVSGGGTPGGSNKQIQFNNSSAFGGASGFEYTTGGIAVTVAVFSPSGTGYTSGLWISAIGGTTRVGIGLSNPQFELEILGEISATNKSFVINHPTKSGMKLRYGSLEGPENGVYVRGELNNSNIIRVPDHWVGLVHEDSYTVHLTPIGNYAQLYVEKIENYNVFVADNMMGPIHCYYSVWAERKDIPKLVTEY